MPGNSTPTGRVAMPIKLGPFDSREAAPEGIREHLEERDGKWFFEAETSTEVLGLKSALDKERAKASAAEREAAKFKGIGDPEKARQLLSDAEKNEQDRLKAQGDWEAREKQLQELFDKKSEQYEAEATRLRAALDKHLVEAAGTSSIAGAKGSPILLLPHLVKAVKVVQEGDEFVARVVDDKGNPRFADTKGTPMSIDQLVEEMRQKKEFQRAFEPSGNGGSGGPPVMAAGVGGGVDVSKMSGAEKLKYARSTKR